MPDPMIAAQDARRELADEFESRIRELICGAEDLTAPEIYSFAQFALDNRGPILDALRAEPARGAEEMREACAKLCEVEAAACLGDIAHAAARFPDMPPDERGDRLAHARASSLLDAAGDIRALPLPQAKGGGE